MKKLNEEDMGKVIVYRKAGETDSNVRVAICSLNTYHKDSIIAVDYPIEFNSKIRYGIYINKDKEVKTPDELKQPGDWYLEKIVSNQELEELNRIGKKPLSFSDIA